MAKHLEPEHLSYLPFHFLLASAGHAGWLKYNDVSTGQFVAEHNTKAGAPRSLAQNPQTAVLCMGHGNGRAARFGRRRKSAAARAAAVPPGGGFDPVSVRPNAIDAAPRLGRV